MLIDARDVSLQYDISGNDNTYALKDIGMHIRPHEMLGIMGPSGSGKSSLLYVLTGLKKATSGVVYYDDRDIDTFSQKELALLRRKKMGFVPQRNILVDYLSVLDNILIPCITVQPESRKRALSLMDQLEIAHLMGRRPKELSFGQQQKVAIARALVHRPEILFADEPTAYLDHKNAMDVIKLLRDQMDHTAVVIVTHDGSILRDAERIIRLWDGRITQ